MSAQNNALAIEAAELDRPAQHDRPDEAPLSSMRSSTDRLIPDAAGGAVRLLGQLSRNASVGVSAAVLVVVLLGAVDPRLFTDQSPIRGVIIDKLQSPSHHHLFGTDELGRDVFSRVLHGGARSLTATLVAVAVALCAGFLLGLIAGYTGRWVDDVIMRLVDVMLAIPSLLLALVITSGLGFGITKVAIAVGVSQIAGFARITRGEVLRVKVLPFVEAAEVLGVRRPVIALRHVLPNSLPAVLVLATLDLGTAIIAVSSLSFLGYGSPAPQPEWGALVAEGQNYLGSAWWITVMPSAVIAAVILAINRISRGLERRNRASR